MTKPTNTTGETDMNISELNTYSKNTKRSIIVHDGKLCGWTRQRKYVSFLVEINGQSTVLEAESIDQLRDILRSMNVELNVDALILGYVPKW